MKIGRSIQRVLLPLSVTAVLAGCTEPSESRGLSVGYVADGAYADPALFRAEVTQGDRRQVIEPTLLRIRTHSSTHVQADAEGMRLVVGEPVTVRVAVVMAPGDTAAAGSVSWTPERNWRYGVTAWVGIERPLTFCMLSVTHVGQLPPRGGTAGDTLFILRSGLLEGTVC